MANLILPRLPKEVLQHICGDLPCQSALDFLLVCRSIYRDCNNWAVWKEVARKRIEDQAAGIAIPNSGTSDRWKRYVIAASKAASSQGNWSITDLEQWILQLATLAYPGLLQGSILSLAEFYDPVSHSSTLSRIDPVAAHHGAHSSISKNTLHTWRLAQAAAFSMTICCLSVAAPDRWSDELLSAVPCIPLERISRSGVSREDRAIEIAMQHTFASRAVGLCCTKLRFVNAASSTVGLSEPPSATTIPFTRLLHLPPPFTPGSLEKLSRCHVSVMADPQFFVEGDWTGYIIYSNMGDSGPGYVGIGGGGPGPRHNGIGGHGHGHNYLSSQIDAHLGMIGNLPYGDRFEGFVRFELVEGEEDGDSYRLRSNNFYTASSLHTLHLTVERETGLLVVQSWMPMARIEGRTSGVITPFGILSCLVESGIWMWLWKKEWSVAV